MSQQQCQTAQLDGVLIPLTCLDLQIAAVIKEAGYAAENVAYGMGGGLLQKVNRDTMSFATKLAHIIYTDGREADIMKQPQTDSGKFSLPGKSAFRFLNPCLWTTQNISIPCLARITDIR